jgi:DNA-binding response OmpR family regulator
MSDRKVVLVVDDEPAIVDMVTTYLGFKGYEVRGANTGADGLTLIPLERPDILLLDLMLPDMEGFEVCARVRAMPEFARMPVLIISARVDPESMVRAEQVGANGYMVKPIRMPDLLAEVKRLLSAPADDIRPGSPPGDQDGKAGPNSDAS